MNDHSSIWYTYMLRRINFDFFFINDLKTDKNNFGKIFFHVWRWLNYSERLSLGSEYNVGIEVLDKNTIIFYIDDVLFDVDLKLILSYANDWMKFCFIF